MSFVSKLYDRFSYALFGILPELPPFDENFQWADEKIRQTGRCAFSHSGGLGDILFSLCFCRELAEATGNDAFDFHIRTNVRDAAMLGHSHPFGSVRMTVEAAEFIRPLLESQPFIRSVSSGDHLPEDSVDLDRCRDLKINFSSGQIQNWYYNLCRCHLPREFWKPVLQLEPDLRFADKILFTATERYRNICLDYSQLKRFRSRLLFTGTQQEYRIFREKYFDLEYLPAASMLEIARAIAGAKGFIGNQSGIFSVAECLKVPRILLAPERVIFKKQIGPGPHVNQPQGGWCEDVATSEKMVAALEELLK